MTRTMRFILLLVLFCGANAVTCPLSGCTYGSLGCSYSSKTLHCDGRSITGPLNITNIPKEVEQIDLYRNQITNISAGMFDGLTALTQLNLWNNQLTMLSAGCFDKLTALTYLTLYDNQLTNISAGMFDGLTALTQLNLYDNQLTMLPAGCFDKLTALTYLTLYDNQLTMLPAGCFDKLTKLEALFLNNNQLTTLPAGVFDKNTALTYLSMYDNQLTTLPAGVFDKNTALTTLSLRGNKLTTLSAGVFDGLTMVIELKLQNNQLRALPDGLFDPLRALQVLYLDNNKLKTISKKYFESMASLDSFRTGNNPFSSTLHTCIPGYYRTTVVVQSETIYACDVCALPGETRAITCWDNLGQNNTDSNHPPTVCPRGSYCDRTTLNKYVCPEGTYNYYLGSDNIAHCQSCEKGSFNPIPGSTSCDFKCHPGTYGNATGGAEREAACVNCPSGKTSSLGASSLSECVGGPPPACFEGPGFYREESGCNKCPPGTFSSEGRDCKLCPPGTVQDQEGQSTCLSNCPQEAACQYFPGGNTHKIANQAAVHQTVPTEAHQKIYVTGGNEVQYPSREQDIAFFLCMFLPAVGLLLAHRRLPEWFRHLDVLFSRKHLVDDTHAVRETESRLGAACTVAFAFFSFMLLYDGYYQYNEIVLSSLLYATSDEMEAHSERSYGELLLRADFLSNTDCASIGTDISPSLDCKKESCEWRCEATSSLSNAHIAFTLPKTTQAFAWNMSVTSWEFQKAGEENYRLKMSMAGVMGPSQNMVLSGTSANPTDVQIELLRGFALYNMGVNRESSGLKILYQLTRRIEETIASAAGEDSHVVRFLLPVSNLVVFEQTAEKLSFQARLALALSLMTSMMAVMSIGKMVVGFAIDKYYLDRENVPADVTRRQVVLKESIITRGGIRRMSSYKNKAPPPSRTISNPLYGVELKNIRTSEKNVHNKL